MSWKAFAVVYTLGITAYALGAKYAADKITPTLGAFIMTACSLTVITLTLLYFSLLGFVLLKEPITAMKALGLLFAGVSIFLLFKS